MSAGVEYVLDRHMARCRSCGEEFDARYTTGAMCVEAEGYTLVLGMDRPVHRCPDMPRWVEAYAMQEAARLIKLYEDELPGYGPVLRPAPGTTYLPATVDTPVRNMEMIRALEQVAPHT